MLRKMTPLLALAVLAFVLVPAALASPGHGHGAVTFDQVGVADGR